MSRWTLRVPEGWLPYAAALAVACIAAGAAYSTKAGADARAQLRFQRFVETTEHTIEQRLVAYVALLRAGSGLFAANPATTRTEFRAFVERLDLARQYPGIQGVGVSLRVASAQREEFVARMRRDVARDFRIWPAHERTEYHAIVYLEPLDRRNLAAIGFDMFTEPSRRAAMERARDSGLPAASGRVTLVQEIDDSKQAGLLIYAPIYRGGVTPATVEARRAALLGFVYSPFRADDLFYGILGDDAYQRGELAVYDGAERDPARLLHRSGRDADVHDAALSAIRRIEVSGRPWTLVFVAHEPEFPSSATLAVLVLGVGLVMATLVFATMRWQLVGRDAAHRLAHERDVMLTRERVSRRHAEEMAAVGRALGQTLGLDQLGDVIARSALHLTGLQAAVLYRREPSGDLSILALAGETGPDLTRGTVIPVGTGTVGRAVRERSTTTTPNFLDDPAVRITPELAARIARAPYRSVLAVPLLARERVIGVLALGDRAGRRFTEDEIDVTEALAGQAGVALDNARLLAEAEAARDTAEAANRAKDEFLATVSHELRTPLNAILGWARMLATGLDPATAERAIGAVQRNAVAQAQLVEDLLDMSRIVSGKLRLSLRDVDLTSVIDAAVDAVRPAADAKGIRVEVTVEAARASVSGDADRLQQVVWNLLSNAVKFTPRGGAVAVALRDGDGHAEIVVADTGQGIAPDVLPHVFERFHQADSTTTRTHGGLGIGLALVRHLVELHGGTVGAISAGEGRGATFTVRLPRGPDDGRRTSADASAGSSREPAPATSLAGVRVVAVDDDEDTLDLLDQVLAREGAEVRRATSVSEAMALMEAWPPHVIVSDIAMPVEDGYALIRRVRALPPRRGGLVPAIAVTAYGRMDDRIRSLACGYQQHLSKPVEPKELVAIVGKLTGRLT